MQTNRPTEFIKITTAMDYKTVEEAGAAEAACVTKHCFLVFCQQRLATVTLATP